MFRLVTLFDGLKANAPSIYCESAERAIIVFRLIPFE